MSNIELNYRGFTLVVDMGLRNTDIIERAGYIPTEVGAEVMGDIYRFLVNNEGRMSPDSLAIEYADAYEQATAELNDPANGLDILDVRMNHIKCNMVLAYCYAMQSNANSLLRERGLIADDTLALEDKADYADTPF
jgi:hypothetical protein